MLPDFSLTPVPTTSPVMTNVSCSPSSSPRTAGPTIPPADNISFPPSSQQPSRGPSAAPSMAPSSGPTVIPHISCTPTTTQPTVTPHVSCNPTTKPTLGPTPVIVTNTPTTTPSGTPTGIPSGMPTPAPFDASSFGGMSGIAAPFPTIDTVFDFNLELSIETDLILDGVPLRRKLQKNNPNPTADEDFSGCRYQPRSEQIVASSPECTKYFPSTEGEFCYRFELFITQEDPPNETLCPINAAIEKIIDAANNGEYASGSTGTILDAKVVRFVETAAPSSVPTPTAPDRTDPPTQESVAPSPGPSVSPGPSGATSAVPSPGPSFSPGPSGTPSAVLSAGPSDSLMNIANSLQANGFKNFVKGLQAADLINIYLQEPGPFTVFAPNSAAFKKLDENLRDCLLNETYVGDYTSDVEQFQFDVGDVWKYHIISGKYFPASELIKGGSYQTLAKEKASDFQVLTFTTKNGSTEINGDSKIYTPNLMASNGVVYGIDTVLFPERT